MKSRIQAKLRSRAGESIGETLVALLISALALLMLAGAVTSAKNVVTSSKQAMDQYYAVNAALEQRDAGAGGTLNTDDKTVFSSESFSIELGNKPYAATYFKNGTFAATPVIVYKAAEGGK